MRRAEVRITVVEGLNRVCLTAWQCVGRRRATPPSPHERDGAQYGRPRLHRYSSRGYEPGSDKVGSHDDAEVRDFLAAEVDDVGRHVELHVRRARAVARPRRCLILSGNGHAGNTRRQERCTDQRESNSWTHKTHEIYPLRRATLTPVRKARNDMGPLSRSRVENLRVKTVSHDR